MAVWMPSGSVPRIVAGFAGERGVFAEAGVVEMPHGLRGAEVGGHRLLQLLDKVRMFTLRVVEFRDHRRRTDGRPSRGVATEHELRNRAMIEAATKPIDHTGHTTGSQVVVDDDVRRLLIHRKRASAVK